METGDVILIGALGVGGYLLYRGWSNYQAKAPGMPGGNALSSMNGSAAATTVFGAGESLLRGLLSPILSRPPLAYPSPTSPASSALSTQNPQRQLVLSAARAPLPTAPSPNNSLWQGVAVSGVQGYHAPTGSPPRPGDPSPVSIGSVSTRGVL